MKYRKKGKTIYWNISRGRKKELEICDNKDNPNEFTVYIKYASSSGEHCFTLSKWEALEMAQYIRMAAKK